MENRKITSEAIPTEGEVESQVRRRRVREMKEYDVFKGEKMDEAQLGNLKSLVVGELHRAEQGIVDEWVNDHRDEVEERSFGKELPYSEKVKLALENEGEEYFEKQAPYYKTLSHALENLEICQGKPELKVSLFCFNLLQFRQNQISRELSSKSDDNSLLTERERLLRAGEVLHKSFYKKDVAFDEDKARNEARMDTRTRDDIRKFYDGIENDKALDAKEKSCRSFLSKKEITALESMGYTIKPETEEGKRRGFLWSIKDKDKFSVKIFKDGKEVVGSFHTGDVVLKFEEKKFDEISKKYLQEKIDTLKIEELSNISSLRLSEFERLSEELERETKAKLIEKLEAIKTRKENPAEAKEDVELMREKGEDVRKRLESILEGGDNNDLYEKFDADDIYSMENALEHFGGSKDDIKFVEPSDIESFKKARKKGPLRWLYTMFKFMDKLKQIATQAGA